MKKETKNKIPKGFQRLYTIDEHERIALEKSIYDKRMMKITKYVLSKERRFWLESETNYIQKILKGDMD